MVAESAGDYPQARAHFEASLAICREIGQGDTSSLYGSLGSVALAEKDYAAARAYFEQAIAVADPYDRYNAGALCGLAEINRREGDYPAARAHYAQALRLEEPGALPDILLEQYASVLSAEGQTRQAVPLCAAVAAQREARNITQSSADHAEFLNKLLADLRDQLGEAEFSTVWQQGRAMTLKQTIEYALEWA